MSPRWNTPELEPNGRESSDHEADTRSLAQGAEPLCAYEGGRGWWKTRHEEEGEGGRRYGVSKALVIESVGA